MLCLSGFRNHSFRAAFWKRDCDFPECKNTDFFRFCNSELKEFEHFYRKKVSAFPVAKSPLSSVCPVFKIPLISTIACFMACILRSTSLFISLKNIYRDDAGSFHRRSSILSPIEKAVSTFHADRESGLFCCPEMCFIARHITENPRPPARR